VSQKVGRKLGVDAFADPPEGNVADWEHTAPRLRFSPPLHNQVHVRQVQAQHEWGFAFAVLQHLVANREHEQGVVLKSHVLFQ